MEMIFKEQKNIDEQNLRALYEDAEWYAYTKDIPLLQQALEASLYVLSAWQDEQLIGLVRVVGDGLTIVYIQDMLVLKSHQNKKIGTMLMQQVLAKYENVRQKVLLTEEEPDVRHFYEKSGFASCDKGTLVAFAKLR